MTRHVCEPTGPGRGPAPPAPGVLPSLTLGVDASIAAGWDKDAVIGGWAPSSESIETPWHGAVKAARGETR
jgi:hypothetical protein